MRAAPEQPPDPSSFAKCCRPHRAQRGPPAPRPTRAASRTPPTPLPRPQTPPSPAADPTHRAPTSPPRPHESTTPPRVRRQGHEGSGDPTWAGGGGGSAGREKSGAGTQRGQAHEACWVPRQLLTLGHYRGAAPASGPPRRGSSRAAARGWREEARAGARRHRPRSSVSGTLPPADVQPGGHSGAASCDLGCGLHRNELSTDRAWGGLPAQGLATPCCALGRNTWGPTTGGRQDRHPQPVLGTDGEA